MRHREVGVREIVGEEHDIARNPEGLKQRSRLAESVHNVDAVVTHATLT